MNREVTTNFKQTQVRPQTRPQGKPQSSLGESLALDTTPIDGDPIQPKRMQVIKRDGTREDVDLSKIVDRVLNACDGLTNVDPMRVATKAISGLYDGATTKELDTLCIRTSALLISDEPHYSKLAARLLSAAISEEVRSQEIYTFSDSIHFGFENGLISEKTAQFVSQNNHALNAAISPDQSDAFEYLGLQIVYDRYLLKNPATRQVIETPQHFFLRVACGLSNNVEEAVEFYQLISSLDYMPSTPTLFNSGTKHTQLSSCYLLDSPEDDLSSIYDKYKDVALLSKFAGGIGLAYHRVRARGSLIRGTNGHSNGIVPWLKTLDSSVAAVNQGGKRKGAACVYLETWHADIEEFLELRDNTGDEAQRTHNINLANWVPDLFMKRVAADGVWSLFDPAQVPHFPDLFGEEFERAFVKAEEDGLAVKQVKARDLYARMMKTLAQTGNGWMTFKDHSNLKSNQTGEPGNAIHLSNLCTEILEVTSSGETAVCNLGSVNLSQHVKGNKIDTKKLRETVRTAVKYLDRVIDINYYPIETAESSNRRWRPVGLGVMGFQDALFKLRIPFDSDEAKAVAREIHENIYFEALKTSNELAENAGPHEAFPETRAAKGNLQFDLWGVRPSSDLPWDELRERITRTGLRNSLLIAIAPTATIAAISGCVESIEPQVSNLYKREMLSGEFLQVNRYLIKDLQERGLWTDSVKSQIKMAEGSIQGVEEIPYELKRLYRTAWELPMKSLIELSAERGPFIDQSHSLNLFMESPTIGKLSSMYMYAWQKGVKTTYYLRSRPATAIRKTTVTSDEEAKPKVSDASAIACSLENPESCESCQ